MFLDEEFDRLFQRMSRSFMDFDDVFESIKRADGKTVGPYYYGYTVTVGPDGKPQVREYGNIKPSLLPTADAREPLVDTLVDEKEGVLKLVAEMPGVEKNDIKVVVEGNKVNIDAEKGDRKYHATIPIRNKIDVDSVKASYTNGILEVQFRLKKEDKPKGKTVEVS
ncbi:archaeal heat shock protein Hsp20 [Candidatus Nitrosotenuis uzonensis]|uniref:Molecular chaperone (Small heat shock protein) n=1 Tax=Candidatus Nitrosotenuis uzonensis TaxID=1407055 RepID=A0A812F0S1_9ARCH|nr:archaeal heat shock protein Hsp20 [Candidatus Nitrosotenuis uzonensis]CAE6489670.1 Molecular chaperone (Small heat shock protein) [Candidatus Nitrosotenuis uzonensis]